jgi:hypothetical protein
MSTETSIEGLVTVFLTPEDPECPTVSGELKKGGSVAVTNKIEDYEEIIVIHRPGEDEDTDDGVEIYAAAIEEIDGMGQLPTAVNMSKDEIINLVESEEPYIRTIADRYGKKYTLGVRFIGASVLSEAVEELLHCEEQAPLPSA